MDILGLNLSQEEEKELIKLSGKSEALTKVLQFIGKAQYDVVINTYITNTFKIIEINALVTGATFDMNDKDDKGFDRITKAMKDSTDISLKLDEIQKRFSEEDIKVVEKKLKAGRESNWFSRSSSKQIGE